MYDFPGDDNQGSFDFVVLNDAGANISTTAW